MRTVFDDVVGHEGPKRVLAKDAARGVGGCYLFLGPQGVGKSQVALRFAMAVNCDERAGGGAPCGVCNSCARTLRHLHPDVHLVLPGGADRSALKRGRPRPEPFDASLKIGVDEIRHFGEELSRSPFEAERRFVLVLDADMVTEQGQNALLVMLEDPGERTTFVLVSSRKASLLPTVVSRARTVRFMSLSFSEFKEVVGEGSLLAHSLLFRLAEGSPRRAAMFSSPLLVEFRERLLEVMVSGELKKGVSAVEGLLLDEGAGKAKRASSRKRKVNRSLIEPALLLYQSIFRDVLTLKLGAERAVSNVDVKGRLVALADGMPMEMIEEALAVADRVYEYTLVRWVSPKNALMLLFSPVCDRSFLDIRR